MRILVDTNVFFRLEDEVPVDPTYANISRLASGKHTLLLHPLTKADIERDKDARRRLVTTHLYGASDGTPGGRGLAIA